MIQFVVFVESASMADLGYPVGIDHDTARLRIFPHTLVVRDACRRPLVGRRHPILVGTWIIAITVFVAATASRSDLTVSRRASPNYLPHPPDLFGPISGDNLRRCNR